MIGKEEGELVYRPDRKGRVRDANDDAGHEEGENEHDTVEHLETVGDAHLVHEPVSVEERRARLEGQVEATIVHEKPILL